MSPPLTAFICYRRNDAYLQSDNSLINNLCEALSTIGFSNIFLDVAENRALGQYEERVFFAIENCDLFVVLIGSKWLDLLRERATARRRDAPVREIRAALQYQKQILPLLVDGATMPVLEDLPREIREFHYFDALTIRSHVSVDSIVRTLKLPTDIVSHARAFDLQWSKIYLGLAICAYIFCAILPHAVGISEYNWKPWWGMARFWSALFIWPMIFLPFALIGTYQPLKTLVQFTARAPNLQTKFIYSAPLIFGVLLAGAVWFAEVYDVREVPWTIKLPDCAATSNAPPMTPNLRTFVSDLSSYDEDNHLRNIFKNEGYEVPLFWLDNKCWPNVLFYLTIPVYTGIADNIYKEERPRIQKNFALVLDNKTRHQLLVPNSWTAWAYRVSFVILVWLGLTGIMMSVYFITRKLRDPNNYSIKDIAREDAIICLTYSIGTVMTWIPFRMVTEYVKFLYSCPDLMRCQIDLRFYMPDMIFGSLLLIGYGLLTAALLARYRRLAFTIAGIAMTAISVVGAYSVYSYRDPVARLFEMWQFYVVLGVPAVVLLALLWSLFSPRASHVKEFMEEIENEL